MGKRGLNSVLVKWVGAAIRYGMVGAACALLNIAIVFVGTTIVGINYIFASICTIFITVPLSYFAHKFYSFHVADNPNYKEFVKFLSAQGVQFLLGLALIIFLVEMFGLLPWISMGVATLILYILGFLVHSKWVFRF